MPPKKSKLKASVPAAKAEPAGPGMVFSKGSFFIPGRGVDGGRVPAPIVAPPAQQNGRPFSQYVPARRFIYNKDTGEAYAEWINDVAICIHTGQELFRSRRNQQPQDGGNEFGDGGGGAQPFDYSVPKQCHPNDYSISTVDMLASGFITLNDFKKPDGAAVRLVDYELFLKKKQEEAGV